MNGHQIKMQDYFYPNGGWAGYNRWFAPAVPSRVGGPLTGMIYLACKEQDAEKAAIAIFLLKSMHVKNCGGEAIECRPTQEAKHAIALLTPVTLGFVDKEQLKVVRGFAEEMRSCVNNQADLAEARLCKRIKHFLMYA